MAVALRGSAQELELPVSPSRVGAGARAAGMADAFVAVADDATAASWNPAGLVQLERPEISVVGQLNAIRETFDSTGHPEFNSTESASNVDLNFVGLTYPLPFLVFGRNVTASLSFQQQYDLSRSFNTRLNNDISLSNGSVLSQRRELSFQQEGALTTISPALAFELTQRISFGIAVNLWRDNLFQDNEWSQTFTTMTQSSLNSGAPVTTTTSTTEQYNNVRGENVTIGFLWDINQRWNLGLRYDSTLRANADFFSRTVRNGTLQEPIQEQRKLKLPWSLAFGAAYRPNDRFTVSADLSYVDWNDFYVEDGKGKRISLVDASDIDDPATRTDFDPTITVRVGFEYVFIPKTPDEDLKRLWTLRWGFFFDQEPASGRSTTDLSTPGTGEPDNFYGLSVGVGLLSRNRVNIDAAYQLRYGNNANSDFIRGVPGFSEDVLQHRFLLSTVIYF